MIKARNGIKLIIDVKISWPIHLPDQNLGMPFASLHRGDREAQPRQFGCRYFDLTT